MKLLIANLINKELSKKAGMPLKEADIR